MPDKQITTWIRIIHVSRTDSPRSLEKNTSLSHTRQIRPVRAGAELSNGKKQHKNMRTFEEVSKKNKPFTLEDKYFKITNSLI